jgi:acetyltransferase-like isoleucine patch superfamily enzyme
LHYPHQVVATKALKGEAKPIALTQAEPLREECLHFLNSIRQKTSPLTDTSEALRTLHVLEMASKALGDSIMKKLPYYVHDTAVVDEGASIGDGTKIWHFSHVLSGSRIGANVSLGQNVVIGPNVSIGAGCKIQNNVSIFDGVTLEEAVFCGPSCVFTNVKNPRTEVNRRGEFMPTRVRRGATIGGNATIVCGNEIGEYAMVGAGAVVTHDVPAHALVVGNPARQIGWVSHSGERLPENLVCPRDGRRYRVSAQGTLEEIMVTASHG